MIRHKSDITLFIADDMKSHYVKSVQIRSFFWSVYSCIRTEYRNIRTRKNSVFRHISRSDFQGNYHQRRYTSTVIGYEVIAVRVQEMIAYGPFYVHLGSILCVELG